MKALLEIIVCLLLFVFIWRQSLRFYRRQQAIDAVKKKQKK